MKIGKTVVVLGVLLCSVALPVDCFIPTSLYSYLAAIYETTLPKGTTHIAMTRMAILRVASDLLSDRPFNDGSRARINALGSEFDEGELLIAYYGEKRGSIKETFEQAINDIGDANAEVDGSEAGLASAHFNAEQFQKGQNRLVDLRRTVVDGICEERYEDARSETGRMLHTLQDFYSHSNWVEMGNSEPYSDLGKEGVRPVVAPPTAPTCTDCREDGSVLIDFIPFTNTAVRHYRCDGNIRRDILRPRLLTSGYYSNQYEEQYDEEEGRTRVFIEKPDGKCSHGGYLDATSDTHARGGMNKDSPYPNLSPHSSQHDEAAELAEQATVDMLNYIREEVDDDEKFGAYLNLFVRTAASVAYVIDTTGSMGAELPEIQATIPQIRSSLEEYRVSLGENAVINYILVPFNDPGW